MRPVSGAGGPGSAVVVVAGTVVVVVVGARTVVVVVESGTKTEGVVRVTGDAAAPLQAAATRHRTRDRTRIFTVG